MVRKEKMPEPASLNKRSLALFSKSLNYFEASLQRRRELAIFFQQELKKLGFEVQEPEGNVFCYLSALVPKDLQDKRDEMVKNLRKHKVFCVRIWKDPIAPDKDKFPNTFEAAQRVVNFPLQNHYTEEDIKKMIAALNEVMEKLLHFPEKVESQ